MKKEDGLIYCDFCSGPCYFMCTDDVMATPDNVSHEYAKMEATWGFYSNKDQYRDECDICEKCYDTMMDFAYFILGQKKGKPRRYRYDMFTGENVEQLEFFTEEQRKKKREEKGSQ